MLESEPCGCRPTHDVGQFADHAYGSRFNMRPDEFCFRRILPKLRKIVSSMSDEKALVTMRSVIQADDTDRTGLSEFECPGFSQDRTHHSWILNMADMCHDAFGQTGVSAA
jgi:hypothetical protein